MKYQITVINPLAAGSSGNWENDFLLECFKITRSPRSPSSCSPRAYTRPPARSSCRDIDGDGRGSGEVAVAKLSWPSIDPCAADALDEISDDDAVSENSGNEEEGRVESQRSRQEAEGPGENGSSADARSSASGVHDAKGRSGGSASVFGVRRKTLEGPHIEDQHENGYIHDDEGSFDDGDAASDDKSFTGPKTNGIEDGTRCTSSSRPSWVGDAHDAADEMRETAARTTRLSAKTVRRQKTSSRTKQATGKAVVTSRSRPMTTTVRLVQNRGSGRSNRGVYASKSRLLPEELAPDTSPPPSLAGTSVDDSESSYISSGEGLRSGSEGETEDDDSDDYELDVLPPNCSGLHKDRKTYKSALCVECYVIYIKRIQEAGLNVSDVDSEAGGPRSMSSRGHRQQRDQLVEGHHGRATSGKQNALQKRPRKSRSSGKDGSGSSSGGTKKRSKKVRKISAIQNTSPPPRVPLAKQCNMAKAGTNTARGTYAGPSGDLSIEQSGASSSHGNDGGGPEGTSNIGKRNKKMATGRPKKKSRNEQVATSVRLENKQHGGPKNRAETPKTAGPSTMPSSPAPPKPRHLLCQRPGDTLGHPDGGDSAEVGFGGAQLARGGRLDTAASPESRTKNKTARAQIQALRPHGESPKISRKSSSGSKLSVMPSNNLPAIKHGEGGAKEPPSLQEHKRVSNHRRLKAAISPALPSSNKKQDLVNEVPDHTTIICSKESSKTSVVSAVDQPLEREEGESVAVECAKAQDGLHAQRRSTQGSKKRSKSKLSTPRTPSDVRDEGLCPLATEESIRTTSGTAPLRKEKFCRPVFPPQEGAIQDQNSPGAECEQQPPQTQITSQPRPSIPGSSLEYQRRATAPCASIGTSSVGSLGDTNLEENDENNLPVDFFGQPRDSTSRRTALIATYGEATHDGKMLSLPSKLPDRSELAAGSTDRPTPGARRSSAHTDTWHMFWSRGDSDGDTEKQWTGETRADSDEETEKQWSGETGPIRADGEGSSSSVSTAPALESPQECLSRYLPLGYKVDDVRESSIEPRAPVLTAVAAVKATATSISGADVALSCSSLTPSSPSDGGHWDDGLLDIWVAGTGGDTKGPNASASGVGGDAHGDISRSTSAAAVAAATAAVAAKAVAAETPSAGLIRHDIAHPEQQHPQQENMTASTKLVWPVMQPMRYPKRSWKEESRSLETDASTDSTVKDVMEEPMETARSDVDSLTGPDSPEEKLDGTVPCSPRDAESDICSCPCISGSCSCREEEKDAMASVVRCCPPVPAATIAWRTPKKIPTTMSLGTTYTTHKPGREWENGGRNQGDSEPNKMSLQVDKEDGHRGKEECMSQSKSSRPGPNMLGSNGDDSGGSFVGQTSDQDLNRRME